MASNKRDRASMREGPLSELFRRTDKLGSKTEAEAEATTEPPAKAPPAPPVEPDPEPATEQSAAATPAGRDGYPHPSLGADAPASDGRASRPDAAGAAAQRVQLRPAGEHHGSLA